MMDLTRKELAARRKMIADQQGWIDSLTTPSGGLSDQEKLHVIIAIAKSLNNPSVSEGAIYASSVLNGKGMALRAKAKDYYADGNYGILPRVVGVVG